MLRFILTWGMVIAFAFFNTLGTIIMKQYVDKLGPANAESSSALTDYFFTLLKNPIFLLGMSLTFLAAFFWIIALSRMELSLAYPLGIALSFLFIIFWSIVLFSESITVNKTLSIIFILIGLYFLYKK